MGYETARALVIGEFDECCMGFENVRSSSNAQAEIDSYVDANGNKIQPDAVPGDDQVPGL